MNVTKITHLALFKATNVFFDVENKRASGHHSLQKFAVRFCGRFSFENKILSAAYK